MALQLNPRLGSAHEALAVAQKQQGLNAEAQLSRKRAEFYTQLPSFTSLMYSEENRKTLQSLDQEATVRKLAGDPSEQAAEFLAALCWSHPHDQLETLAFEALEARGARTTPLLQKLLENAGSTCTIRSTAHILARRKMDGLFEFLEERLPGDLRAYGMEMDIAGALDDLGDPRAVGPLCQMLAPGDAVAAQENGPLMERRLARARAALALGAFDTPESRKALEARAQDPQLGAYCRAALYRITRDPKQLASLEKAVGPEPGFTGYVVGNYLVRKAGTDEARKLAKKWDEQRNAQNAAEEAKTKTDASTKPGK
jgi:hypothetical protein